MTEKDLKRTVILDAEGETFKLKLRDIDEALNKEGYMIITIADASMILKN
jgi:hypothetical protein